ETRDDVDAGAPGVLRLPRHEASPGSRERVPEGVRPDPDRRRVRDVEAPPVVMATVPVVATRQSVGPNDALRARILLPIATVAACGAGLAAGKLAASNQPILIFGLAGALVPVVIWKWSHAGVVLLLAVAAVV